MTLEVLKLKKQDMNEQTKQFRLEAENIIKNELRRIFDADPTISNVAWAQKMSEYNDEGLGYGVVCPVLNVLEDDQYWMYGYNDVNSKGLNRLNEILQLVGPEVLSEMYGDSVIVIVTRDDKIGGLSFSQTEVY